MQEKILHFIWQHQYYKVAQAVTTGNETVQVSAQGFSNANAGPDFSEAKLKIGNVDWAGDVEIHIKSSDWNAHKHQFDKAYNKVILHVVWQKDKEVMREDGTVLPTLELNQLVDKNLLVKVDGLIHSIQPISCATQLGKVAEITIVDAVQKALVKRLERKAELVQTELNLAKGDWEEVAYRLFMRQMGMKVNGDAFYHLAENMPYKLIRKYSHSIRLVEALLFGMSGLLHSANEDEYIKALKAEYKFLAHKHCFTYQLKPEQWKFLRLRPSNFPTLRLAQAAAVLANSVNMFELFTEFADAKTLASKLKVHTSTYWQTHYRFAKDAKKTVPNFGKTSIDLLLLNIVSPLLAAYSVQTDNQQYIDKAIELATYLKPEQNRIIREWNAVGITVKNGGESQGLIELYNEHCASKKCLSCGIGFSILKK